MAQEKGILPKTGSYLPASVLARILDKAIGSNFFVFDDFKDSYEMNGYVVKSGCHIVDGRISYNNEETNIRDKVVGIGHYGVFVRTDMNSDFSEIVVKYSPSNKEAVMTPEKNDNLKEYGSLIPNTQAPDNKINDKLLYYFFYDGSSRKNNEDNRVLKSPNDYYSGAFAQIDFKPTSNTTATYKAVDISYETSEIAPNNGFISKQQVRSGHVQYIGESNDNIIMSASVYGEKIGTGDSRNYIIVRMAHYSSDMTLKSYRRVIYTLLQGGGAKRDFVLTPHIFTNVEKGHFFGVEFHHEVTTSEAKIHSGTMQLRPIKKI